MKQPSVVYYSIPSVDVYTLLMFPICCIGFIRTRIAKSNPSDETLQQGRNLDHGKLDSPSSLSCIENLTLLENQIFNKFLHIVRLV